MPEVTVVRAFDLVREDGTEQRFFPGKQEMSDADASHWQTMANLDSSAAIPPRIGSYEYHTLHPAIMNLQATELAHAEQERIALEEEDRQIAAARSQSAAQRREAYQEDIANVRQGKPREGLDDTFHQTFMDTKIDPDAKKTAYPAPGSLPNQPGKAQTDNTTDAANSADGPGETEGQKASKRERLKAAAPDPAKEPEPAT